MGSNEMFKIDDYEISENNAPYIIAEISANHNGKIENAFKIIDMARRAGANAIKMQTYTPDTITLKSTKPDFQIKEGLWAGTSLYELYEKALHPGSGIRSFSIMQILRVSASLVRHLISQRLNS